MKRVLLFVPLLIFFGLGLLLYRGMQNDPRLLPSPLIDQPFPAFALTSLQKPDQQLNEATLRGEASLVNVWATWCGACRIEHPWLMQIAEEHGVAIYGVNYKDDRAAAIAWLEKYRDPYREVFFDPTGELGLDLGVYGAPETFIVDAGGIVRYKHVGVVDDRVWTREILPRLQALEGGASDAG